MLLCSKKEIYVLTVIVRYSVVIQAMRLLWERAKIVVEPSGSVGLAVALSPPFLSLAQRHGWKNIVIILSGGNVDLDCPLPWTSAEYQLWKKTGAPSDSNNAWIRDV